MQVKRVIIVKDYDIETDKLLCESGSVEYVDADYRLATEIPQDAWLEKAGYASVTIHGDEPEEQTQEAKQDSFKDILGKIFSRRSDV
jgi:hypothetical protein